MSTRPEGEAKMRRVVIVSQLSAYNRRDIDPNQPRVANLIEIDRSRIKRKISAFVLVLPMAQPLKGSANLGTPPVLGEFSGKHGFPMGSQIPDLHLEQ